MQAARGAPASRARATLCVLHTLRLLTVVLGPASLRPAAPALQPGEPDRLVTHVLQLFSTVFAICDTDPDISVISTLWPTDTLGTWGVAECAV